MPEHVRTTRLWPGHHPVLSAGLITRSWAH